MEEEKALIKHCVERLMKIVSELEDILTIIDEKIEEERGAEYGENYYPSLAGNSYIYTHATEKPHYNYTGDRAPTVYWVTDYGSSSTYSVGVGKESSYE